MDFGERGEVAEQSEQNDGQDGREGVRLAAFRPGIGDFFSGIERKLQANRAWN